MHLAHTVSGQVLKVLKHLEQNYLPRLRKVVAFLRSAWTVERFVALCLDTPEARTFADLFPGRGRLQHRILALEVVGQEHKDRARAAPPLAAVLLGDEDEWQGL